jgi:excisionase family DNA binding protein
MARRTYSTVEAAKLIGVHLITLNRWLAKGKIRSSVRIPIGGGRTLWRWTDSDIARGRKIKAQQRPGPKKKVGH